MRAPIFSLLVIEHPHLLYGSGSSSLMTSERHQMNAEAQHEARQQAQSNWIYRQQCFGSLSSKSPSRHDDECRSVCVARGCAALVR